jgi:hypothetical protein
MPRKGQKGTYNYGRIFQLRGRDVRYRYVNKDKSTKTLVDAKTKKPISKKFRKSIHDSYYN